MTYLAVCKVKFIWICLATVYNEYLFDMCQLSLCHINKLRIDHWLTSEVLPDVGIPWPQLCWLAQMKQAFSPMWQKEFT